MRPDRLDCPREGVFPLNIGRYRVATPKTMSGKNEGEWFSEKWTSKTRAPKHPHFLIAKQQDSCDKTAGNGGQNMPMLQGSKIGRSLPGKPFTFDSHQPLSPHKQQTQARQSYRLNPKVPAGSRRNAPQLPAAPHSPPRRQAQSAEAAAGTRARNNHVPPHQPSGPNQQRPHRRPLAAESPQAGAGLSFQNTPQTSVAPCPRLRRSRTRRHTWSRTF